MSLWFSALLGLIQGLTEFLPVSSSGHLAIFQSFFGMENVEESQMLFEVLLHFATLIPVVVVYWADVRDIVAELWCMLRSLFDKKAAEKKNLVVRRLILLAVVATLPLALAVVLDDVVGRLGSSTLFVGIALLCTGCILYVSDRLITGHKNERNATVKDALLVGLMQLVAILPGISRSGSTITAGLFRGFDRKFAVKVSFLLSIPAILGANILKVGEALRLGIDPGMLPAYLVGMAVAAVSGYFAIRVVRILSDRGRFGRFAYYCWAVGALTVLATILF